MPNHNAQWTLRSGRHFLAAGIPGFLRRSSVGTRRGVFSDSSAEFCNDEHNIFHRLTTRRPRTVTVNFAFQSTLQHLGYGTTTLGSWARSSSRAPTKGFSRCPLGFQECGAFPHHFIITALRPQKRRIFSATWFSSGEAFNLIIDCQQQTGFAVKFRASPGAGKGLSTSSEQGLRH